MMRYLIEQDADNASSIYNRMKALKDKIKSFTVEQRQLLAKDPNGYGKDFWPKVEKFIEEIKNSNLKPSGDDLLVVNELKEELEKFGDIYKFICKDVLDNISPKEIPKSSVTTSKRSEKEVKDELDNAIRSKDQKRASELFDELGVIRKRKDPSYEPTDLLKKYPAAGDAEKSPDMPKPTSKETPKTKRNIK